MQERSRIEDWPERTPRTVLVRQYAGVWAAMSKRLRFAVVGNLVLIVVDIAFVAADLYVGMYLAAAFMAATALASTCAVWYAWSVSIVIARDAEWRRVLGRLDTGRRAYTPPRRQGDR